MGKLSRKESMAIITIHDALREFRCKGRQAQVNMMNDKISIHDYANTANEAKALRKLFCFFKDDEDTIEVRKIEAYKDLPEFWVVRLIKSMV